MNGTVLPTAPDILSVDDVAELLHCDSQTVELQTRNRKLPGVKFGRSWIYPRPQLLQVLGTLALQNTNPAPANDVVPASPRRPATRPRGLPDVLPPLPVKPPSKPF